MMPRRPEPEVMDDPAQAHAYAEADFEEVNQGLADRLLATEGWEGPVLDLGCGPADIPLRLCRARGDIHVCAVDASLAMLRQGRARFAAEPAFARVLLLQGYLPGLGLREASFGAVFSNSLLHHLADPLDLWRSVRRYGRPGAPVLVCDLFRPPSEADAQAIVDAAGCSDDPILRTDFFNSLLAAYTVDEVRGQLDGLDLGQLRVEQSSERHLLVTGTL